jgi:two-component system cell cycle response regulator
VFCSTLIELKDINDKFGHPAGDEVIKYFAGRVSRAIRGSDVTIRTGGNEFLLLLPACKPEEVQHVLGRMSGMRTELGGQAIPSDLPVTDR